MTILALFGIVLLLLSVLGWFFESGRLFSYASAGLVVVILISFIYIYWVLAKIH